MNKLSLLKKLIVFFIGIIFVLYISFITYLNWPRFFPKYKIGTCIEDVQVHRLYKVTGIDDWLKGSGIPVEILSVGDAIPNTFYVGEKVRISADDPLIQIKACPTD